MIKSLVQSPGNALQHRIALLALLLEQPPPELTKEPLLQFELLRIASMLPAFDSIELCRVLATKVVTEQALELDLVKQQLPRTIAKLTLVRAHSAVTSLLSKKADVRPLCLVVLILNL